MKRLILLFIAFSLTACAAVPTITGPRNQAEMFPLRNQDPRMVLVIYEGTAHANIYVYNDAGALIEQGFIKGASRFTKINGRHLTTYLVRELPVGRYRVEVYPFYYAKYSIFSPRYRFDLPKRATSLFVDRNPTSVSYQGRHWSRILQIYGGNIPETAAGIPGITFNLRGNFFSHR